MRSDYSDWLEARGYHENTCNTQKAHIRQIEKYYGDLDQRIENGELEELINEFTYTKEDERAGRENPTKVEFSGRNYTRLQSLKGAIKRYAQFLSGESEHSYGAEVVSVLDASPAVDNPEKQRFALERDMQMSLRVNISALDERLTIVDEGIERSVESGFIDVLCEDDDGSLVVIELKSGKTDARVVGQILGYMGDLLAEGDAESVRGIIIAHEFDKRTISATRAIPNLKLVKYCIEISFEDLT